MLQATEYQVGSYLTWLWRTNNFDEVMHRRTLVLTSKAKLLLALIGGGLLLQQAAGLIWLLLSLWHGDYLQMFYASLVYLSSPLLWAHLAVLPLLGGDWLLKRPYVGWRVRQSRQNFAQHKAIKIAVAGSYGKTTMKEILLTVLAEGKKIAATPANKNVAVSHAAFASQISGNEEVLVIEYGEAAPGDIARFARNTKPDIGIITGLAPAHLDKYKTLSAAGHDLFSLANYVKDLYVNDESHEIKRYLKSKYHIFNRQIAAGWKIAAVKSTIRGVELTLSEGQNRLVLKSRLLGRHQTGPLALAAVLGLKLGLSKAQIESGVQKILPFDHRMQPRQSSGAWIIDDTYNGNIEGMLAGLELLKELKAKRKVYVTPGLVDQGSQSEQIHQRLGQAIAEADPDITVLMKHSVTDAIVAGLESEGYQGQLIIEEDPLRFYQNLDQFIAAGDLVLLQNDWPDQYQ